MRLRSKSQSGAKYNTLANGPPFGMPYVKIITDHLLFVLVSSPLNPQTLIL